MRRMGGPPGTCVPRCPAGRAMAWDACREARRGALRCRRMRMERHHHAAWRAMRRAASSLRPAASLPAPAPPRVTCLNFPSASHRCRESRSAMLRIARQLRVPVTLSERATLVSNTFANRARIFRATSRECVARASLMRCRWRAARAMREQCNMRHAECVDAPLLRVAHRRRRVRAALKSPPFCAIALRAIRATAPRAARRRCSATAA